MTPRGQRAPKHDTLQRHLRAAILVGIVRTKPGLTTNEVFREWIRSDKRKEQRLPAMQIENDLRALERENAIRRQADPAKRGMVWFLKF